MVHGAKDTVGPLEEVGGFLIEKMEFRQVETIEVSKHEEFWWLLGWGEPAPGEDGLDGAIRIRVF